MSYERALVAFVVLIALTAIFLAAAGFQWFVRKKPLPMPAFLGLFVLVSSSGGVIGRIVTWWILDALTGAKT